MERVEIEIGEWAERGRQDHKKMMPGDVCVWIMNIVKESASLGNGFGSHVLWGKVLLSYHSEMMGVP